jgi:uncharacterized membrane protein YfcA
MSTEVVLLIIFLLATIQSIFGVGLLVFGTPTFLLLGHSFPETLAIVLPPSILVSLFQVLDYQRPKDNFRGDFLKFSIPTLIFTLIIGLKFQSSVPLKPIVALVLIVSGLLKLYKPFSVSLVGFTSKNNRLILLLVGVIQGLTNLGGGLLTFSASSQIESDKRTIRSRIAFAYLLMALVQYTTLILFDLSHLKEETLLFATIALINYLSIGRRAFNFVNEGIYTQSISIIILLYGVLMVIG